MPAPRKYPDDLRERAVRLYRESEPRPTFRKLGQLLNVHPEALRNWVRQIVGRRVTAPDWRSAERTALPRPAPRVRTATGDFAEADAGERTDRPTTDMLAENKRLAAENAELRRVNEVLRAASAYFAAEIGSTRRWS